MALSVCTNCGRAYEQKSLRTFNKKLVCSSCFLKLTKKDSSLPLKKERIEYICLSCNYKFSRNKDFKIIKCPFCGKENLAVNRKIDLNKLIAEL